MLTPLTIVLKVILKEMLSKEYELKWHGELPSELKRVWVSVLSVLVGARIECDRSIMPREANGRPVLAAFFDCSDLAFSGVLYRGVLLVRFV